MFCQYVMAQETTPLARVYGIEWLAISSRVTAFFINTMSHHIFFSLMLLSSSLCASAATERPNFVFFLADDLGICDVNAYAERFTKTPAAQQFFETPNIDRIVREGFSFSTTYACPLCSPTRASLMTGKNGAALGVTTATAGSVRTFYNTNTTPPAGWLAQDSLYWGDAIPEQQPLINGKALTALATGQAGDHGRTDRTLPSYLVGYRNAFMGKWHLGGHGAQGWQPGDHGFEELAYYDSGGSPHFDWRKLWDRKAKWFPEMPQPELRQGKSGPDLGNAYLTDEQAAHAEAFIRDAAKSDKPFLLYHCAFGVHSPWQAKPEDIAHFKAKPTLGWNGQRDPVYAAMVKSLDESVGRIIRTLEETGLAKNTIFVFMSDNGGIDWTNKPSETPPTDNAPFFGGKACLYEGGIRVPLTFWSPGGLIPKGVWSDIPVDSTDLLPTFVDFSGGAAPSDIDGRSLRPLFSDPTNTGKNYAKDTFYWHYPFNVHAPSPVDGLPLTPHSAIRHGKDKLIFNWNGEVHLYDLAADPYEKIDLAEKQPDTARRLFKELNTWLKSRVADRYIPHLNPRYIAAEDHRKLPFRDLRAEWLGPDWAITPALGPLDKPAGSR